MRDGVYFGEDGFRFARDIARMQPRGRILDVGSGTGLATLSAASNAEEVLGIEINASALESAIAATRIARQTAVCSYKRADFETDTVVPSGRWDCVITNLPGVPVPGNSAYTQAGDGGADGLDLVRAFFQRLPQWWRAGADTHRPCLIMRLQSYGDARRPAIIEELTKLATRHNLLIEMTIDSRMDFATRSALTANYLARSSLVECNRVTALSLANDHADRIGMEAYYSSSVTAIRGASGVRIHDHAQHLWLDRNLRASGSWRRETARVASKVFWRSTSELPMGFWELGTLADLDEVISKARQLYQLISVGATAREACRVLWSNYSDPYRSALLASVVNHLISTMISAKILFE